MSIDEFILELNKLNIYPSELQLKQLNKYYHLLIEWNEKINLTTITLEEQVYLKHFYDSLTLVKAIDFKQINNFCDVGTGAGFPGIVIKIFFPHIKVTLVDSLNKRIIFLKEIISQLELHDIEAVHARAEDYAKVNRELFDVVSVRAVASLNVLIEYCIPLVKINGYFLPLKGNISEEIILAQKPLKTMHSEVEKVYNFLLPIENSERNIIKIIKKKSSEKKYPRSASEIKKRPL